MRGDPLATRFAPALRALRGVHALSCPGAVEVLNGLDPSERNLETLARSHRTATAESSVAVILRARTGEHYEAIILHLLFKRVWHDLARPARVEHHYAKPH